MNRQTIADLGTALLFFALGAGWALFVLALARKG